jgi:hypothetical protein
MASMLPMRGASGVSQASCIQLSLAEVVSGGRYRRQIIWIEHTEEPEGGKNYRLSRVIQSCFRYKKPNLYSKWMLR